MTAPSAPTPPDGGRVDLLRGCAYCQAAPGDWCEHDCGSPAPIVHPDYREEPSR